MNIRYRSRKNPYLRAFAREPVSKTDEARACKVCGSQIAMSAKLCSTCKSYQNGFKNFLFSYSTVTGFILFAASAITYIGTTISDTYKEYFIRKAVGLHAFSSIYSGRYEGILYNQSANEVLVSHLTVESWAGSTSIMINKIIPPHSFTQISERPITTHKFGGYIATNYPVDIRSLHLNSLFLQSDTTNHLPDGRVPCFWLTYMSSDYGGFLQMKDFYSKQNTELVTDDATIEVYYYSSLHPEVLQNLKFAIKIGYVTNEDVTECIAIKPAPEKKD